MIDPVIIYAAAAAMAGVLIAGGLEKAARFTLFENAVAGYALLPAALARPFALGFIAAELLGGGLLLAPATRVAGALLALLVLLIATAGVVANLLRGRRDIDCGCGGLAERSGGLSWWLLLRNGLLAVLCVPALLARHAAPRSLEWVDALTFFGAALAVLGLYACLNQLIDSHGRFQKT